MSDLLKILREFGISLPKTKSALFRNKQDDKTELFITRIVSPGKYLHFGIEKCINRYETNFISDFEENSCHFNVDGLPLYKSSRTSIWPILGSFSNCRSRSPFIVGAWVGEGHPSSD